MNTLIPIRSTGGMGASSVYPKERLTIGSELLAFS